MKIIVDSKNKTLQMLENNRSIFRGEYGADVLELYFTENFTNEYPTITALLSNGRKIGAYTTDEGYSMETINGVEYVKASFTLSKQNGFTLSEGKMMITIWMNSNGRKEAIGNVTLNVINTTAFDDGDIIVSGDVEGTIVNYRVELENLQSQINTSNVAFNGRITSLENKTKNYFDLGSLSENPLMTDNTELNPITSSGLYTFYYAGKQYLMLVDAGGVTPRQVIISKQWDGKLNYIERFYREGWIITNFDLATLEDLKGKADSDFVEEMLKKVNANEINISSNTQNVERLIEHVTSINNSITSLLNRVGNTESETIKLNDNVADLYLTKVNVGEVYDKVETDSKLANKVNNSFLTSNYYNKEAILEMINNISSLELKVVEELPTENIGSTTIYLIKKEIEKDKNIYEEYVYLNGNWEMIGNTEINMNDFVKPEQVMPIVEENSTQTIELELTNAVSDMYIVTSKSYSLDSDKQIPTVKAVRKIFDDVIEKAVGGLY